MTLIAALMDLLLRFSHLFTSTLRLLLGPSKTEGPRASARTRRQEAQRTLARSPRPGLLGHLRLDLRPERESAEPA